jgi:hypothetical protein
LLTLLFSPEDADDFFFRIVCRHSADYTPF